LKQAVVFIFDFIILTASWPCTEVLIDDKTRGKFFLYGEDTFPVMPVF
jgi:hypothetical protein